jgi:hypothetical protein
MCTFDYDVYCQNFRVFLCVYREKVNVTSSLKEDSQNQVAIHASWANQNKAIIGFGRGDDRSKIKGTGFVLFLH